MRRLGLVVTTCTLLVSACGSDRNDAVSTTVAPVTTVAAPDSTGVPTSETVGSTPITSPDTSEPAAGTETKCVYRKRLLIAFDDLLTLDGFDTTDVTAITDLAQLSDIGAEQLTADDFDSLFGPDGGPRLFLYDVGEQDPLALAHSAQDLGVDATPVLVVTPTYHWTFAPGTPWNDDAPMPDDPPALVGPETRIAVIDTGYTDTPSTPQWLKDRVEVTDPVLDADHAAGTPFEGHGKFVASVIAQQEPQTHIVEAAMPRVEAANFYNIEDALPPGMRSDEADVADELGFAAAVGRLVKRDGFDVLNLSVGSWSCDGLNRSGAVFESSLNRWDRLEIGSFVVAAAGNHGVEVPADSVFIPAAWGQPDQQHYRDNLISVFALDKAGVSQASFSNPGTVGAIGVDLLGIREDGHGTYWGGSSFATAVVSAWVAANDQKPTSPTIDLAPSLEQSLKP